MTAALACMEHRDPTYAIFLHVGKVFRTVWYDSIVANMFSLFNLNFISGIEDSARERTDLLQLCVSLCGSARVSIRTTIVYYVSL